MSRHPVNQLLLFACAVHLCFACVQCGHHQAIAATPAGVGTPCPPNYPTDARLVPDACPPPPAWCQRLRGHKAAARSWRRRCRPGCRRRLQFGGRRYPVAWSRGGATNKAPVLFGLALHGWRGRSLTVWRRRVYARRGGGGGPWLTVYPVEGGKLVAVDAHARPPYNCGCKKAPAAAAARAGARRLRGLRSSCHGNRCTVRLSLRQLLRQVAHLRRQRRRRLGTEELCFVLAVSGRRSRARFVSGELALQVGGGHRGGRGRRRPGERTDPAEAYRQFLDRRREKYWRQKGRRGGRGGGGRKGGKGGRNRTGRGGKRSGKLERRDRRNSKGHQHRQRSRGGQFKPQGEIRGAKRESDRLGKEMRGMFDFLGE